MYQGLHQKPLENEILQFWSRHSNLFLGIGCEKCLMNFTRSAVCFMLYIIYLYIKKIKEAREREKERKRRKKKRKKKKTCHFCRPLTKRTWQKRHQNDFFGSLCTPLSYSGNHQQPQTKRTKYTIASYSSSNRKITDSSLSTYHEIFIFTWWTV